MPPATSDQALANLTSFQNQMKAPQDILSGQEQALGVPQAQQQVSGLRQAITNTTNLLNQVAPSVYGRTQQSLVTSAQAGRQIANEQQPIQEKLTGLGQQYSGASADYSNLLDRASTLAGLEQTGQESKLSGLKSIYETLFGKEQDARQQALEQAKLAETVRSNQASESISRSKASADSNVAPSAQDIISYFITAPSNYGSYNPNGTNYHRWQAAEQEMISNGIDPNAYKKQLASAFGSADDKHRYGVTGF